MVQTQSRKLEKQMSDTEHIKRGKIKRVVLTCALRAQVKKLKMEVKHNFCLENIRF
jgi:hypothetical protein